MTANEMAALRRFCGYPVPMCDACRDATGTDCKSCNAWRHLLDVAIQQEREIADGLMAKWKETQQEMRAELAGRVSTDIHTRLATLSKRVLDRLRAADGFTTVGSLYDEDFAGDVAQLRQAIEDYENG